MLKNKRIFMMIKKRVHPLRKWRTDMGFTQTEVASILGYHTPGIIHSIETYKLEPKIGEIEKLCKLSEGTLEPWDFLIPGE